MICACRKTDKRPIAYIPAYKLKEELFYRASAIHNTGEKTSFQAFADRIDRIYPNNDIIWHFGGPWRHLVKIQEEIAEIHEAYSALEKGRQTIEAVKEEIADSIAWTLSAWRIIYPNDVFDHKFIEYYYGGCPICKEGICTCGPRSERAAELIDKAVISEVKNKLDSLNGILEGHDVEIEELKKSLQAALESGSEPVARHAAKDAKTKLDEIERALDYTSKNADRVSAIVGSITKILSSFGL